MYKLSNIIGQKINRLLVQGISHRRKGKVYLSCLCDCGKKVIVQKYNLTSGHTKSCGCYQREFVKNNSTKHGMRYTRFYTIWKGMRQRCYNKNAPRYKDYGGRGIVICIIVSGQP